MEPQSVFDVSREPLTVYSAFFKERIGFLKSIVRREGVFEPNSNVFSLDFEEAVSDPLNYPTVYSYNPVSYVPAKQIVAQKTADHLAIRTRQENLTIFKHKDLQRVFDVKLAPTIDHINFSPDFMFMILFEKFSFSFLSHPSFIWGQQRQNLHSPNPRKPININLKSFLKSPPFLSNLSHSQFLVNYISGLF
jgi:hypothetical protein